MKLQEKVAAEATKDHAAITHQRALRIHQQHLKVVHSNQSTTNEKYKKILSSIDIVRKQMMIEDVCQDLIKIKNIIKGLFKYDRANMTKEE